MSNGAFNKSSKKYKFDSNMIDSVLAYLKSRECSTIVDIGCGGGEYVRYLREHGLDCKGYDGNKKACREVEHCEFLDLSQSITFEEPSDWVISFEVGEHIPKEFEANFIGNLHNNNKDGIILSWARVGQRGRGHINCQDQEYLMPLIQELGYVYNDDASNDIKSKSTFRHFRNNIMVFEKKKENKFELNQINYKRNEYGFWVQEDPQLFRYDNNYKQNNSNTTPEMSYLRLGWLFNFFSYQDITGMKMVDIGSGNDVFFGIAEKLFKETCRYDIVGVSITKEELLRESWDMICLFDVIEHMTDIKEIFDMDWEYAYISYPETPLVSKWEELESWRHFRPDEHIWCLHEEGMVKWLTDNNCEVLGISNFEDSIRKRWDVNRPNITSMIVKKH